MANKSHDIKVDKNIKSAPIIVKKNEKHKDTSSHTQNVDSKHIKPIKVSDPVKLPKISSPSKVVKLNKSAAPNDSAIKTVIHSSALGTLLPVEGTVANNSIENDANESVNRKEVDNLNAVEMPVDIEHKEVPVLNDLIHLDSEITISTPPVKEEYIDPKLFTGMVKLIYEQYNEEFEIKDGSTTAANIDETYCLSFVMPNCLIHLSLLPPIEKRTQEIECNYDIFVKEDPRGTFHGLRTDSSYYVYVDQEADQLKRDQEIIKLRLATHGAGAATATSVTKDDGRVLESCSCLYGNPCVDEYGCKDWNNRYAVAKINGWKGF
eukprot:gene13781-29301_t